MLALVLGEAANGKSEFAEEFEMSVRQIKNIVYKSEDILFNHK